MRSLLGRTTLRLHEALVRVRDKVWSGCVAGVFQEFGRRSVLALPCRLGGARFISIGANAFLGPGCWLQTLTQPGGPAPSLRIGDGVAVAGGAVLSAAREVVLEDHVLLARNVYVSDHMHAYADPTRPVQHQGLARVAAVRVRRGAWLGQNVVVCPGVTIGEGSVVGANSVVTEDVPDFAVAVGAPARVIKCFGPEAVEPVGSLNRGP